MLRVAIIDDHPVVREGLKRIITGSNEFTVAAEWRDGEEALRALRKQPCDVVVLDISLPRRSGLEVLKQIRAEYPRLPVLMLSVHPEAEYATRVLRAGASGYLSKDSSSANLVSAIKKVTRGGRYVSPELAERLALGIQTDVEKTAHEILSDREYQTMCLLASGKTVGEIAAELGLSVKTISTYRVRVLEKLELKNNAELMRYAIKNGLAD